MNVYTLVAMKDLHDDVESLPGIPSDDDAKTLALPADSEAPKPAPIRTDLANLAGNWAALPEHIRKAITALARG